MIPYFEQMPKDRLIRLFKQACIFEFISCILLFLIAMPIKYEFDIWWQMIPIGSLHGAAFTWYLILLYYVRDYMNWDDEDLVIAGMAAFFPFGTLWVEREMIDQKIK